MLFNGEISTLAELISPMTQQEFLDCYTKQRPVFIRGGKPSRVAKLINVNDVSDIIQKLAVPSRRILIKSEKEVIPSSLYTTREGVPMMSLPLIRRILNAGASLIIESVDEAHPKIGDLAQALELEFSSYVWANAYLTTKEGGAFKVHYDTHDVIVLQICGSKRWHLFGRTEEYPVEFSSDRNIAPKEAQKIDILRAGEVLFVPRGEYHRAEVVDSPSFHLTIGIKGLTGADLVLDDALKNLKKEALFRKYLPRVGGEQLLLEHEKRLKSSLHDWVERLSTKAFLAGKDASRAPRSDVIPWNPIHLTSEAKIWLALRRRSPIVDLDSTEIVVGGRTHHIFPTERLILKIIEKCGVLRFDDLIGQVRAMGDTIAEAELAAAVVHLTECGLLNISMDDETSEDKDRQ